MTTTALGAQAYRGQRVAKKDSVVLLEYQLLTTALVIASIGLVMVFSSSIGIAEKGLGDPLYYFTNQFSRGLLGVLVAAVVYRIPLYVWEKSGFALLIFSVFLVALVLLPGLGKTVNGSTRWLNLGLFSFQVSEMAKLLLVIYLAGYLVRRGEEVRTTAIGFIKPMLLLSLVSVLLLMEPDFGAAVVLLATGLGMLFLGGSRFWQFSLFLLGVVFLMALLAVSSPYRLERITSFLNPWNDPFNSGFQLTQSLIAIGSGGWFGLGLGASIQKMFYLPEAHTDFLFAILSEEMGLIGAVVVICLFFYFVFRCFRIGAIAESVGQPFAGFLCYGIGLLIGLQAVINIGVNMGVLPTKGLTLPLMSYGGNSLIITCFAVGLLLRAYRESVVAMASKPEKTSHKSTSKKSMSKRFRR